MEAWLGRFSRLFKEKFRKVLKKFKKVRMGGGGGCGG
jgi:hypothetical protein